MDKIVTYGNGSKLGISASALTPFLYREKHNRDLAVDMRSIHNAVKAAKEKDGSETSQLSALDIRIVLYAGHTMAYEYARKHGEQLPPDDPFEWIETFDDTFLVYEIATPIFELWSESSKTLSKPKKK